MIDEGNAYFYIWGAGRGTRVFLHAINAINDFYDKPEIKIAGIIDRNREKWGEMFDDLPIVSLDALDCQNCAIIIPLQPQNAMKEIKDLERRGFVRRKRVWLGSEFLSDLVRMYWKKDNVNEYENLVGELFDCLDKQNIDRGYLFSELVILLVTLLSGNNRFIPTVVGYLDVLNWAEICNDSLKEELINQANCFFGFSLGNNETKMRNKNIEAFIDNSFLHKYLYKHIVKPIILIDNRHALVFDGNVIRIVNGLIDPDYALSFVDLSDKSNSGWKNYVELCVFSAETNRIFNYYLTHNYIKKSDIKNLELIPLICAKSYYLRTLLNIQQHNYDQAVELCSKGLEKYPINKELCCLYGDILYERAEYAKALRYYSRCMLENSSRDQLWMISDDGDFKVQNNIRNKMWECVHKYAGNNPMKADECIHIGLADLLVARARFRDSRIKTDSGKLFVEEQTDKTFKSYMNYDYILSEYNGINEYYQGELHRTFEIDTREREYLVPIQRIFDEEIFIEYNKYKAIYSEQKGVTTVKRFEKHRWVLLRVKGRLKITSLREFAVGELILLNSMDPRIVINLFIDALAFSRIKDELELYMPNTYAFFNKGCIFLNCCGVGEWTQSSYPSMTTGMKASKLNVFHPRIMMSVPKTCKPISIRMREKGYYCMYYAADSSDMDRFSYMGVDGGYHRYYIKDRMNASEAIGDAVNMLYKNNGRVFFNIHTTEVHDAHFEMGENATMHFPSNMIDYDTLICNDTYYPSDTFEGDIKKNARLKVYLRQISALDYELKQLYDYLTDNYCDSDYQVILHSDHGAFGGDNKLSREHTNIALMMRGKYVPNYGVVEEDMVSGMDLSAIYEYLCGIEKNEYEDAILPRVFGGMGRDYTITQWRYPNQKYYVAINKPECGLMIESRDCTRNDCSVDVSEFSYCALTSVGGISEAPVAKDFSDMISVFVDEILVEII